MDPISLYAVTQKVDKQTFFINQKSGKEKKSQSRTSEFKCNHQLPRSMALLFQAIQLCIQLGGNQFKRRDPVLGEGVKRGVEKEVSYRDACVSLRYFKILHTNKCGTGIYVYRT